MGLSLNSEVLLFILYTAFICLLFRMFVCHSVGSYRVRNALLQANYPILLYILQTKFDKKEAHGTNRSPGNISPINEGSFYNCPCNCENSCHIIPYNHLFSQIEFSLSLKKSLNCLKNHGFHFFKYWFISSSPTLTTITTSLETPCMTFL